MSDEGYEDRDSSEGEHLPPPPPPPPGASSVPGYGAPDVPGYGAPDVPPPPSEPPLTPLQQAVVDEVAQGQRSLGLEMGVQHAATWGSGFGRRHSFLGGAIAGVVAGFARQDVKDSEDAAQFLAEASHPVDDEPRFPAGGPPTPEEVHEAEMNPWPHHSMAETIDRNRALRRGQQPGGTPAP